MQEIDTYYHQAEQFNARLNRAVERMAPVIEARSGFIEARPLSARVERLGGPERILKLMDEEIEEMREEERLLLSLGIPVDQLDGQRNATAVEASDVIMFASSGVPLLPEMNLKDKTSWLEGVEVALQAGETYRMNVVNIGVAIIRAKLDYNYPAWAFKEIPGETDEAAIERNRISIKGLKAMRSQAWDGWLSPKILEENGFTEDMKGNPKLAYDFLKLQAERV